MGLLDRLLGRNAPNAEDHVESRPPPPLPPRRTEIPGAPIVIKAAGLAAPAFAGAVAEQLLHDLHDLATKTADPADRLYIATLIRAVKNDGVELPMMPEAILRIRKVLASPDASVDDLARVIKPDPGMSAKFIGIANSAIYARGDRIGSVEDAVVRVGFNQATAIVMAVVSKAKMFRMSGDEDAAQRLHRHALATAATAKSLAFEDSDIARDAFIAGMLHDIGRVFMLQVAATQRVQTRGQKVPNAATVDAITDQLHAGFSALVAERWELGENIASALQFHHLPESGGPDAVILIPKEAERLTYTIAAADVVAHVVTKDPVEATRISSLEGTLAHIGVSAIDEVVALAEEGYQQIVAELEDEAQVAA